MRLKLTSEANKEVDLPVWLMELRPKQAAQLLNRSVAMIYVKEKKQQGHISTFNNFSICFTLRAMCGGVKPLLEPRHDDADSRVLVEYAALRRSIALHFPHTFSAVPKKF